ncbi:MAG: sulfite exporter TauE/SafE family protein [bacterium]
MIIQLILIILLITLAIIIESIVGFGTSSISLPILSLFYPLHQVILFVGIIQFISSIWKLYIFRSGIDWKLIFSFGISAVICSFLGAYITLRIPIYYAYKIIGTILIIYSTTIFLNGKIIMPQNNFFIASGGAISGFLSGLIGLGGAIRATFLHAADLPKLTFIFTATFISFFIDIVRLTTYVLQGTRLNAMFIISIIFYIPVSILGVFLAKKFVDFIPQQKFRMLVTIFLAIFGVYLLIR